MDGGQQKAARPEAPVERPFPAVQTGERSPEKPVDPPAGEGEKGRGCIVRLNGRSLQLPPKPDGAPYYLMDLLERSGIDFRHVDRPVLLAVNGAPCTFQQRLHDHDSVEIRYEDDKEQF